MAIQVSVTLAAVALLACGDESGEAAPILVPSNPPVPMSEARSEPPPAPGACAPLTDPVPPGPAPPPALDQLSAAVEPPPPVVGGGLRISRDGTTAIITDIDRDRVHLVDLPQRQLRNTLQLSEGDQPTRVVEDADGRVHVVLSGSGHVVSLDQAGEQLSRRAVCDLPRGIDYDQRSDSLHVACYEGQLLSLPAAGGAAVRTQPLPDGLRDVVVDGDRIFVSRFREAELLTLDDDGVMLSRARPLPDERATTFPTACSPRTAEFVPAVAWRTVRDPDGGVVMLHQRHRTTEIPRVTRNYYGDGGRCGAGVLQVVMTFEAERDLSPTTAIIPGAVLDVDLAISPDRRFMVVGGPGNHLLGRSQVQLYRVEDFLQQARQPASPERVRTRAPPLGRCAQAGIDVPVEGEAVAVAIDDSGTLLVHTRQPSELHVFSLDAVYWGIAQERDDDAGFYAGRPLHLLQSISLGEEDRQDLGHALFHANAGSGIACASCHPEGGDDGVTWRFQAIGPRRTQDIRGGLIGTQPFHWSGDMPVFRDLVREVFVGRMGGFEMDGHHVELLVRWLDSIPSPRRSVGLDALAVERGRSLFRSQDVGCTECHDGALYTDNRTVDVGTGEPLQVPSLKGISFRGPFMHDGCAENLHARFAAECGGGDSHGRTSQLQRGEVDDLVEYLRSL